MTTYNELLAACWQAQTELDRTRQAVERTMRVYDDTPDGPKGAQARQRMRRAVDAMHAAERQAIAAADALIAFEDDHGD